MTRDIELKLGDPVPSDWLQKAEAELKSKFKIVHLKEFRDKENVEIHIHRPTVECDTIASDAYSKTFNRLLNDPDYKTNDEMEQVLIDRGIWGTKQEEKIEGIQNDMQAIAVDVCTIRDNKNAKRRVNELKEQWKSLRVQLEEINLKKQQYLGNTIESRADEAKLKVKLSLCVKYPDGTQIWPTVEDLSNEEDATSVSQIVHEAVLFWSGISTEIIQALPDHIFNTIGEAVSQSASKKT